MIFLLKVNPVHWSTCDLCKSTSFTIYLVYVLNCLKRIHSIKPSV